MSTFVTSLDQSLLEYLFAHRDLATTLVFINISELGSTIFVCGIGLCIALVLALRHKIAYAIALAVSVLGAGATTLGLKEIVHRARPEAMYQAYIETGYSFPSGHATLAAALYGSLTYFAWRMMPAGYKRNGLVLVFVTLIALIVFSRLYLGLHYLSDVIAGLLVGGVFAWIGSVVAKKIER
ncbi:hypothetical protein A3C18_03935 [Candidatus Kaiserbacteria bacterium RIFCSPHIGHO2_02_FULL_54_11b]|uniref:Phosphatidic acid phosphatase type 2/haloperoxidase domain-containing protein n=2 Tax=Candidatus Kaiseribacteriota TaxID=1752734 RepID=A0A1F6CNR4_9BACT|nr:MAG: hypothetical protein A2704_00030 [Candidatus Kaiserbacteria bacterium RIFCSPHIGHO2_01_FULL_54_36b]OGG63970.1 MAG: hypothetical protein A3C18_03935 [Candidatus Kaiserbacteria bacterium RIFCSPHIGHO2_02_FULL_54_11b]